MASMMNVPVIGLVENMSYLECPDCKKKINVFGESKIEQTAKEYGIEKVARIPINPEFAKLSDDGAIEDFDGDYLDAVLEEIIKN